MPDKRAVLIVFHMHGCPHCPPAMEAAQKVQGVHAVAIASEHKITEDLGITSFPTIWLALLDDVFDYGHRPRECAKLQQWVDGKLAASRAAKL